jgi:hypothetical protein
MDVTAPACLPVLRANRGSLTIIGSGQFDGCFEFAGIAKLGKTNAVATTMA